MAGQPHHFIVPTLLVLATILFVFAMKYLSAARLARSSPERDDAFRRFAEKAAAAQDTLAASLTAARAELADVKARLGSIEAMLRDVG